MFGIFEKGKAGYIFLFIIIVILIFLTRGGVGPFSLVRGSKEEDREEDGKQQHQVLYSRTIGKDTEVVEEVVEEEKVEGKNDKGQVLFNRVIGKSESEEPTHTVLYSRTIK